MLGSGNPGFEFTQTDMAYRKHTIITMPRLERAIADVWRELQESGLGRQGLDHVEVYLTLYGNAYGYQHYRNGGHIKIPMFSLARIGDVLGRRPRFPLRDLLRHEYAHAVADNHRALIRSRRFRDAFGSPHDSEIPGDFDPDIYVSEYAATDSSEDFAETTMYFLKHKGRLPRRFDTPAIRKKWQFVDELADRIASGARRW